MKTNQIAVYKLTSDTLYVRRGEPFNVSVVALGQGNGAVPIIIRAQFPPTNNSSFLSGAQDIQESGDTCSELQYSVFSSRESVEVVVYADGPCRDIGNSSRLIAINFLPDWLSVV